MATQSGLTLLQGRTLVTYLKGLKRSIKRPGTIKTFTEKICEGETSVKPEAAVYVVISAIWLTELLDSPIYPTRAEYLQARAKERFEEVNGVMKYDHSLTGSQIAATVVGLDADALSWLHIGAQQNAKDFLLVAPEMKPPVQLSRREQDALIGQVNMWLKMLACSSITELPSSLAPCLPKSKPLKTGEVCGFCPEIKSICAVPVKSDPLIKTEPSDPLIKTEPGVATASNKIASKRPSSFELGEVSPEDEAKFPFASFFDRAKAERIATMYNNDELADEEWESASHQLVQEAKLKQQEAIVASKKKKKLSATELVEALMRSQK